MPINGDATLAKKMVENNQLVEQLRDELIELQAKDNKSASDNSRIYLLETQLIPTAQQTFYTSRTNYLATVPSGEEPQPVETIEININTPEYKAVQAAQKRSEIKTQYDSTVSSLKSNQTRASKLQAKVNAGTATPAEQTELNTLNNTTIPTLQTQATTQRTSYNNATKDLTQANETIIERGNIPLVQNSSTTNENNVVVEVPETFPSDITNTAGEGGTDELNSTLSLNLQPDLSEQRIQEYARIDSEIAERQQENRELTAQLESEREILSLQEGTGVDTSFRESRITGLQEQINLNSEVIDSRQQYRQQMEVTDAQRTYRRNNQLLNEATNRVNSTLETQRTANQEVIAAQRELQQATTPEEAAQARQRLDQANLQLNEANRDVEEAKEEREHINRLRTDRDYFEENYERDPNTGIYVSADINATILDDPPVEPPQTIYGPVTEEDRQDWINDPDTAPTSVFDTYTGQSVTPEQMQEFENSGIPEGRYVLTRQGIDSEEIQTETSEEVVRINNQRDSQLRLAEQRRNDNLENALTNLESDPNYISVQEEITTQEQRVDGLTTQQQQLEEYIASEGGTWNGAPDARPSNLQNAIERNQIVENELNEAEQARLDAEQRREALIEDTTNSIDVSYQAEIDTINNEADQELTQAFVDSASERQSELTPVTTDEARALIERRDRANERESLERERFTRERENAIRLCQNGGGSDCTNPDNWSEESRNAVNAREEEWTSAREEVQSSQEAIASASVAPNGEEALLAAGATNEEIQDAQLTTLDPERGNADQPIDAGNKADELLSANTGIRPTGFEDVNDGAPFYVQYPTLNAITDFRFRNGYSPYGPRSNDAIARDAVHFNLFELTPPSARAELSPDGNLVRNVVENTSSNLIGTFTVYPNQPDWLSLNHQHSWGNEQLSQIANTANSVLGAVDTVQSLLTLFNNVSESTQVGLEQGLAGRITRRLDTLDTYQSTEKLEITIPFVLFTKKDFLQDVFRPLMLLTAMTYPKRLLGGNIGKELQASAKQVDKLVSQLPPGPLRNALSPLTSSATSLAETAGNTTDNAEQQAASAAGYGPFRYYVSKRPEYLSMRHASGLMYFPICYIKNISYDFKGPWYNYDGKPFTDIANVGRLQDAIKSEISLFSRNGGGRAVNNFINSNELNRKQFFAFPSIAEVKITVRNALPFFRDDWMDLFSGAGLGAQDLVNVSVKQTGNGKLIDPNSNLLDVPVGSNQFDAFSSRPSKGQTTNKPKNGGVNASQATNSSVNGG